MMDGHPMRRRRIEVAARRATLARLRRAGHQWVPIPTPDGALVLYATGGPGRPLHHPMSGMDQAAGSHPGHGPLEAGRHG
jgi:hypothetical protein